MSTVDLLNIVNSWARNQSYELKAPNLCALKVKISNENWNDFIPGDSYNQRSFEMSNTSPHPGSAHLSAVKESRPVTIVHIRKGVLKGCPKRAVLSLPERLHQRIGLSKLTYNVGQEITLVVDPTRLEVDTTVNLQQGCTKVATMQDSTVTGEVEFTCIGKLSGKVIFEKGEIHIKQIMKDMEMPLEFPIKGSLKMNFEDNHTLMLQ